MKKVLAKEEMFSQQKIYKTLKIVKSNGEGAEIDFGYHIKHFKCKNGCEHHNHLVCVVCRKHIYLDYLPLEDFQDQLAKDNGFKPTKHNFKIFGVCAECQQN